MKNKLILAFIFFNLLTLIACVNNSVTPVEKGKDDILEEMTNSQDTANNDNLAFIEKDLDVFIDGRAINYKMLKEEITSILGQPLEVIEYDGLEDYKTFRYDGIEISFMGSYTDFLIVDNSIYPTYRGLSVGDDIQEMFQMYGKTNPVDSHDGENYYMYSFMNDGIEIQLFFVEDENKIKEYYFSNSL